MTTGSFLSPPSRKASRALGWSAFMLGLLCLYLIPEIIFNAKLVSIAGGRVMAEADLRAVELFGRAISGVGVTLLIADWLIRGRSGWFSSLFKLAVVAVVVWPVVFFGQKWLVDAWLIDPSAPEQRQQAVTSQLLKASLANNTIAIEGVAQQDGEVMTAAEMTFLTSFGALVYLDDRLIESIDAQRSAIARQYVRARAYGDFDSHYEKYQELRQSVRQGYQDYLAVNARFETEIDGIDARVDRLWDQAEQRVSDGWSEYQRSLSALDQQSQQLAQQMAPRLYQYFDRWNNCRTDNCRNNLDNRYRQDMEKTPLGYVSPDYWLIEKEVSTAENLLNTGVAAILSGGVTLAAQGLNKITGGDGGWKDKTYSYTSDVSHYQRRIRDRLDVRFQERSGYPANIQSFSEFRLRPETGQKIVTWGRQNGLELPAGWTMVQKSVFRQRAANYLNQQVRAGWYQKAGLDKDLVPGMTWDEYQRSNAVQRRLRDAMGPYYVNGMSADWNNAEFKRRVVDPGADRKASDLLKQIEAQTETFADGQPNEDLGKRALRATLIPPISMTLSLALTLITLVKVPLKARDLWRSRRGKSAGSPVPKRRVRTLPLVLIIAVLALPPVIGAVVIDNPYLEEDGARHYFLGRIKENSHAGTAWALNWALHAQPVLLPVGLELDRRLSVFRHFEAAVPRLEHWDNALVTVSSRFNEVMNKANSDDAH